MQLGRKKISKGELDSLSPVDGCDLASSLVSSNSDEKVKFCLRQYSWVRNPTIIPENTLLGFLLSAAPNLSSSRRFYFIQEECFPRGPNSGSFELAVETAI